MVVKILPENAYPMMEEPAGTEDDAHYMKEKAGITQLMQRDE